MPNGITLFYSYAHADEKLREELEKQLMILQKTGVLESWHDRKITAGSEWKHEIDAHVNEANVILLLVSSDFIASDYSYDIEVTAAMKRHEQGEAVVIPIILRPVNWKKASFSRLQALPKDGVPVTSWPNGQDAAFAHISERIEQVVEELLTKKTSAPRAMAKPAVYLAETTDERKIAKCREGIAFELEAQGYPIISPADTPDKSPDYENEIDNYMKSAKLSVHLIGSRYGRTIAGAKGKSVIELQNLVAEKRRQEGTLQSVIWIPPDVVPVDTRQDRFHKHLETALENAELSRKPFESVKERIVEKLENMNTPTLSPKSVYLMCEQSDWQSAKSIKNLIYDSGFQVYISPSLNGIGPGAARHDEYLRECDATLIYYGTTNDDWVDFMLWDLQKAPKLRKSEFLCKALFLPDPEADYRNPYIKILKHDGNSVASSLRPFIDCLQRTTSGGAE